MRHHRETIAATWAVIAHWQDGRSTVTYEPSPECANDVAVRRMYDPTCLYAYVATINTRLSNIPAIRAMPVAKGA